MRLKTKPISKYALYWIKYILPFVSQKDRVLDVGAGRGDITGVLNEKYKIDTTAIDVKQPMIPVSGVKIIVYDGQKIPFKNNSFDAAILRAVLHHCQNPEKLLLETKRVTKKNIFVFEDIYENAWEKYSTFLSDSLMNFFDGPLTNTIFHPHNNKTFDAWLKTFRKLGLKIRHSQKWYSSYSKLFPFRWHFAFFVLEK